MPILTLLLRWWQPALVAVALGFGALEWKLHDNAEIARGIAIQQAHVADSTLAVLQVKQARIDTVWRRDTLLQTRTVQRVDSIRVTLLKNIHDTTEVIRYVQATDSALRVCSDLRNTCQQAQDGLRAQIVQLQVKLAAQPIAQPRSCVGTGFMSGLLGAASGFGLRAITHR